MSQIRKRISRVRLFLSILKPISLSHHPNCERFDEHVYHIGNKRLCIGCFTFYPVVILTIFFTFLFVNWNNPLNSIRIFFISLLFMLPVLLSLFGLTKLRFIKILSKVSIGIGVGLLLIATIFLPVIIIVKVLLFFEVNCFIGVIAYLRTKSILKECDNCIYKGNWNECPEMKPIMTQLYENKFFIKKEEDPKSQIEMKI